MLVTMVRNLRIYLVLLLVMTMVSVSCQKNKQPTVTNTPPGVTQSEVQNWYIATGILQTVADTTDKGLDAIINLNRTGIFPDGPAYKQTIQSFKAIGQLGIDTKKAMENQPQKFGTPQQDQLRNFSNQVSTELQKLTASGLVGIKDEASKARINTFISLINSSLQLASTIAQ